MKTVQEFIENIRKSHLEEQKRYKSHFDDHFTRAFKSYGEDLYKVEFKIRFYDDIIEELEIFNNEEDARKYLTRTYNSLNSTIMTSRPRFSDTCYGIAEFWEFQCRLELLWVWNQTRFLEANVPILKKLLVSEQ